MRPQFQALLFVFCLNLATGTVIALQLPGTSYVEPLDPQSGDMTDYEERFNATETAHAWDATPYGGIPVVGDIFAGFYLFFNQIRYLLDGFPTLLQWICDSYITDAGGVQAFTYLAWMMRAVFALLMATFVVEFITGRSIHE